MNCLRCISSRTQSPHLDPRIYEGKGSESLRVRKTHLAPNLSLVEQKSLVEYKMERKTPGQRTQLFAVLLLGAASLYLTWSLVGLPNDVKTLVLLKRRRSSIIKATDSYCEDLPISPYQSFNLPKSIHRKRPSKATSYRGEAHQDDSPRKCSLRYHGTRGRTRMALDGDDWRWARPNRQREANVRSGDVPRTTLPAGYPRHNRERLEQHQPRTAGPYPSLLQLPSAVDLVRRGCYS